MIGLVGTVAMGMEAIAKFPAEMSVEINAKEKKKGTALAEIFRKREEEEKETTGIGIIEIEEDDEIEVDREIGTENVTGAAFEIDQEIAEILIAIVMALTVWKCTMHVKTLLAL